MRKFAVAALLACGPSLFVAAPAVAAPNADERVQVAELPADSSDSYQYGFEDASVTEQGLASANASPARSSQATAPGARAVQTSTKPQRPAAPDQAAADRSIEGVEVAVNTQDAPAFAR